MPVATFTARPRPGVAPPAAWQYPAPEVLALDSGLPVYLHHLPGQHVVTIACHLRAWADDEPAELAGVSAVMAALLGAGTRQAPLARESAAAVAAVSADLAASGLAPGCLGTLLDEAAALTPVRVNAAARQYLDPAGLTVLAAGDPAALEGPLTDLVSPVPLRVIRAGNER